MARRIELLDARHERAGFDCGDVALNEFLRRQAGQQQRRGFGKTYVSLDAGGTRVTGFVTVSVGQVAAPPMPAHLKLPRYPVPMLRVGRLAVDKRAQGNGLGQDLLAFALHLALEFSTRVGLYAVVVDAKHEKAAAFYRRLDFEPTLDNGLCLFLPLSKVARTRVSEGDPKVVQNKHRAGADGTTAPQGGRAKYALMKPLRSRTVKQSALSSPLRILAVADGRTANKAAYIAAIHAVFCGHPASLEGRFAALIGRTSRLYGAPL